MSLSSPPNTLSSFFTKKNSNTINNIPSTEAKKTSF